MPGKKTVKRPSPPEEIKAAKKVKASSVSHSSHRTVPGLVLALGQGDVGQLGLGEDVMERKKPALVSLPEKIVQAEAGGMHTVCLSETGNIYTFGCNDEGALGRDTSVEGSEMSPGKVELKEKIVQVSAGDSHTAALTEEGRVYIWGSFRDNNGVIGLLEPMKKCMLPVQIQIDAAVLKIASGNDHLVMLTVDGELYSSGCGEQGQLGRVPERFTNRGGRRGLERLLIPQCVPVKGRSKVRFQDVFCGAYVTFAVSQEGHVYGFGLSNYHQLERLLIPQCVPVKGRSKVRFQDVFCGAYVTFAVSQEGHVYGFGLSNYHQLGTLSTSSCFAPLNLTAFKNSTKSWVAFSGGQHHTLCLDSEGKGRNETQERVY
ncbi:UNVERIFIED_CONTAM: hypothetical protein FKN15_049589 [Acipenser sinensis]